MSFNQYLPFEELNKSFDQETWDSLNHLLETFLPKEETQYHILINRKLLGKIHHSANLDKYKNKIFRIKLFDAIPPSEQYRYFRFCGVSEKLSSMSFTEKRLHVHNEVGFKWGNNKKTRRFLDYCNYPDYLIPDETLKIKKTEVVFGGKQKYFGEKFEPLEMLYSYQSSVVYRVLKKLETPNSKCLIQMPTGAGKTKIAMTILAKILLENPTVKIIWLASKHELLEQARDAFIKIWIHVGRSPINISNLWIRGNEKSIPTSQILIFSTYGILNNLLEKGESLQSEYIFVDEAHQILAPTYSQAINKISSSSEKETRLVGLTATPGRGISEEQNTRFTHIFHKEIVKMQFDEEDEKIYRGKPLQYLEDNEILAKTISVRLDTNYEFGLSVDEWKKLTKVLLETGDYSEFNEQQFKKMANDNVRNILIIRKIKELVDEGKKILYFSTTKNQSLLISTILQQIGIKAIHVSGETDKSFRRQVIKKFRDTKDIDVVCNYDIFTTGFDMPKLEVVFIARPVNSPVLYNQIVGRGTRGKKMNGTSKNYLVQVIDKNPSPFFGVDLYKQYGFWDKNWNQTAI